MRLALYRKYRPVSFDSTVGQEHVTRTLSAAVKRGLVSHAYLFTGPKGVGKTSVARILARDINALSSDVDIATYLDIIEIDAASNRGIDEIRSLRERIASAPTELKYKVYIIDEVHMLTREAFNALLKTLEEPPAHAVFILATTEAHKLPDTIISRTQRFDFRPITQADLVAQLSDIAHKEKLEIETAALELLAEYSHGGFRDAISMLDQVSAQEGMISLQIVADFLGLSPHHEIGQLLDAVATLQPAEALKILSSIISRGTDPVNITHQLLEIIRAMMLQRAGVNSRLDITATLDDAQLVCLADYLTQALADFKTTHHYSLPLELAIYKAALPPVAAITTAVSKPQTAPRQKGVQKITPEASSTVINTDEASLTTKALSLIKEKNNSLYAVMRSADPKVEGDKLVLNCRFRFHKERIEEAKNRQLVESIMTKTLGRPIELECAIAGGQLAETVNPDTELVSSALEILGGEIVNG